MGQLCTKRKRKFSDDLSLPEENVSLVVSSPTGGEEIGLAKKYMEFLEKNKVTRKENFFDFFSESPETVLNLLFHQVDVFESEIDKLIFPSNRLKDIEFPIYFDFIDRFKYFPHPNNTGFSGSRAELIGWYLKQSVLACERGAMSKLSILHASGVLEIAVRVLLGKKPKTSGPEYRASLKRDLFPSYSESVIVLILCHLLLDISVLSKISFSSILNLTGYSFVDLLLVLPCDETVLPSLIMALPVKSEKVESLIDQIALIFPPNSVPLKLLKELSCQSVADLIYLNFSERLERKYEKKIESIWLHGLRMSEFFTNLEERNEFVLMMCEKCPLAHATTTVLNALIDKTPSVAKQMKILNIIVNFFQHRSFSIRSVFKPLSRDTSECLFHSVVVSAIRQSSPDQADWTQFIHNIIEVGKFLNLSQSFIAEKVFVQLLHSVLNKSSPIPVFPQLIALMDPDVPNAIIRNILFCSDLLKANDMKQLQRVFKIFTDIGIPEKYYTNEKKLLEISQVIFSLLISVPQNNHSTSSSSNIMNLLMQSSLATDTGKDKKRRKSELMASSTFSSDFISLQNLIYLQHLATHNKEQIFHHIFNFNLLAFLETDQIYRLCELLDVPHSSNHPVWIKILHLAAIAYISVNEQEGSESILHRLALEFKYPDTWRIALAHKDKFGHCSPQILTASLSLCPREQILNMLNVTRASDACKPRKRILASAEAVIDVVKDFPNLSDTQAVESFLSKIGNDDQSIAFEHAELLVNSSTQNVDPFAISALKIASIGCF